MKPIYLRLQAFGPYLEEQVVDFRAMDTYSFFMIQGPTGSGKSSLLDAICFALYGSASNSEKSEKVFRSDNADPKIETFVSLEFEVHQKRYRVVRSPSYEKQKLRGEGTTTSLPTASLEDVTDLEVDAKESGKVLTPSKISEVTKEIESILGFDIKQFRQVIVLPQNEFRKALLSTSKERAEILEILFRAGQYKELESILKEKSKNIKNDLEQQLSKIDLLLSSVESVHENEVEQSIDQLSKDIASKEKELDKINKDFNQLEEVIKKETALLMDFENLDKSKSGLLELEGKKDEINSLHHYLDRYDFYQKHASKITQLEESVAKLDSLKKEISNQQNLITNLEKEQIIIKEKYEHANALLARRSEFEKQIQELAKLSEKKIEFDLNSKKIHEKKAALEQFQTESKKTNSQLEQLLAEQQKSQKAILNESELISEKYTLEKEASVLENLIVLSLECDDLSKKTAARTLEQSKLEKVIEEKTNQSSELRAKISDYKHSKEQNLASYLSKELQEEKPCPVCGSTHHPKPAAEYHAEHSDEEIQSLEKQLESINQKIQDDKIKHTKGDSELEAIDSRIQSIKKEIDSNLSVEEITSKKNELTKRLAFTTNELGNIHKFKQGTEKSNSDISTARSHAESITSKITRESTLLDELLVNQKTLKFFFDQHKSHKPPYDKKLDEIKYQLANAESSEKELREIRIAKDQNLIQSKSKLSHLQDSIESLSKSTTEQQQELKSIIEDSKFQKIEELSKFNPDPSLYQRRKKDYENYLYSKRQLSEKIRELNEKLKDISKPEIDQILEQKQNLTQSKDVLISELSEVKSKQKHLEKTLKQIKDIKADSGERQKHYEKLCLLSDIASGERKENPTKIKFHEFVLQAQLDEVLECATQRLRVLSRNRYELRRNQDDHISGQKSTALDLIIDDYMTGKSRPVSTLSGGELFLASLSLALGLADVVQQYSGGIELSTLFIDEGFGSLDPESLDLVIDALLELQKGNKLIGIISHVEELKRRIDVQLEIVPATAKRGAQIVTHFP